MNEYDMRPHSQSKHIQVQSSFIEKTDDESNFSFERKAVDEHEMSEVKKSNPSEIAHAVNEDIVESDEIEFIEEDFSFDDRSVEEEQCEMDRSDKGFDLLDRESQNGGSEEHTASEGEQDEGGEQQREHQDEQDKDEYGPDIYDIEDEFEEDQAEERETTTEKDMDFQSVWISSRPSDSKSNAYKTNDSKREKETDSSIELGGRESNQKNTTESSVPHQAVKAYAVSLKIIMFLLVFLLMVFLYKYIDYIDMGYIESPPVSKVHKAPSQRESRYQFDRRNHLRPDQ